MIEFNNRSKKFFAVFVLVIIVFIAFWPSLHGEILNWDDRAHLTQNPAVQSLSLSNIKLIFTQTVLDTYIPLTTLSYAIEYHFAGLNPFIYHLNNLLLHLGVTVLIFFFAVKIGLSIEGAFMAGLLFGIHPMHVESVAWITERKDVLYAFFYMLALIYYWKYLESKKVMTYCLTVIFGALSLLTKSMAISLPLIFFLCDWFYRRKINKMMFIDKIPYFLYIVPIAWITYSLNKRVLMVDTNLISAFLIGIWSFSFYIKKFFVPVDLIPGYGMSKPVALANPEYSSSLAIILSLLLIVIIYRKNRWIMFALLYYCISIFFLLRFTDQAYISWVADRFMYLPSLGICLLCGKYFNQWINLLKAKQKFLGWIAYGVVGWFFLSLSVMTFAQNKIWENDIVLWTHQLKKKPDSMIAYSNRALEYKQKKQPDLAIADFSKVLALAQDYINKGYQRGVLPCLDKESTLQFIRMSQLNAYVLNAYNNRGILYAQKNFNQMAIDDFTRAIEINPEAAAFYVNRAKVLIGLEKYFEAITDLSQAIRLNPVNLNAYQNRALCYRQINEIQKALADEAKFQ